MAAKVERIGIGMVGAGSIARARHVPGFKALPGVELVGVANRTIESSRRAAKEFGFARTYETWPELIADPAVDAVVIGTWPYLHAPITLAALQAGKHVLTQARMAMDGTEARAMVAASLEHSDLVTMVVPAPTAGWADEPIRRLLAESAIGTLRTARLVWGGSVSGGHPDPWRRLRRYSGNNIMAVGILYEGVARWLGHASTVQARTEIYQATDSGPDGTVHFDVPDFVAITAEFPGRVIATLEISAHAAFGGPNSVHLFGTAGTIRVDFDNRHLEIATAAGGEYRPVEVRPVSADWRVEAEFIGAIRGQEEVRLTDFATGARYMAFTDAVNESARTGRRVAL